MRAVAVLALAAALAASGCGGRSAARTTTAHRAASRPVPGEAGRQYAIGAGRYLYLECMGYGSPTVVLEAGLGLDHRAWYLVQPELAQTTRVCSYDRSGLGLSQQAPKRATALEKAHDLHALLRAGGIGPPYVLVGHSYGGMLARVYTHAYPPEVSGVVLLDAAHPDQGSRLPSALPPPRPGENRGLHELRLGLQQITRNDEGMNWQASAAETRAAGRLGARPLVVVTAGEHDLPAGVPPRVLARLDTVWLGLQDDLARLSSDSVHVIAVYSPHMLMTALGQPELVVRAIRADVAAVRADAPLPRCRALFPGSAARCVGPGG